MDNYGPESFGALNAEEYDDLHDPGTTDQAVDLLFGLFGASDVLELAIGTGRIALPLARRGVRISGIEGSPLMVDGLRAKPGGTDIPVVIGDMADGRSFEPFEAPFDHAFLVFNTLFNLTSQEAQVRCFGHTAARLRPGGLFVIETFVPDHARLAETQRVETKRLDIEQVWLEAAVHDPIAQTLDMQRIRITKDGTRLVPLPMRYAFPAEIDLMAQLAGLRLRDRWGGWDKQALTATSGMHISVYEKL
ncbi:class I SAM-dependent DNA methyltransferase [Flavimaricola marinus]|uniref:Cypemycin methyltransferase n=1 Tax=Flavimaricola marinus TaxID=1819565 RepID=A0A238LA93_9RHOB|nr:class I SAM-dependent methyltransferase [Flavimaricola marinus]SMY06502.1 Cypemycin methyltransferase [Flavimaricola marinus]